MSILGIDEAILTTTDMDGARKYLRDFGLDEADGGPDSLLFNALDGTGVRVCAESRPGLPAPVAAGPNIRACIWGVSDAATIGRLRAELSSDREVREDQDGTLWSEDDDGNAIGFRVTRRKTLSLRANPVNVHGLPPQRGLNQVPEFGKAVRPATFSHLVLYTPDASRIEAFYAKRLGFRVTDRFTGAGFFARAEGNAEHHQLFFIERANTRGLNHIAFHVSDHLEMMLAGKAFAEKGWESAWGPGRHIFGGNHFWYFKSPFGGNFEFDCDMDVVDDSWSPREAKFGPENAAVWVTPYQASK